HQQREDPIANLVALEKSRSVQFPKVHHSEPKTHRRGLEEAAHPQLRAPHVYERLTRMPARGLVDFHVVTRHPKFEELLVLTHELEVNELASCSLADQIGPGIPDRRQLFVEPPFYRTARDLPNRPAGF